MIRSFNKWTPSIDTTALIDKTSLLIGKIGIKKYVSIWPQVLIRASEDYKITIDEESVILDKVFIEAPKPTAVGKRCIVSHGAIVHGGNIGDNVLVGIGAIILGASVGDNSIIGAGSVVTKNISDNMMVNGVPGRAIRPVTNKEIEQTTTYAELLQDKALSVIEQ